MSIPCVQKIYLLEIRVVWEYVTSSIAMRTFNQCCSMLVNLYVNNKEIEIYPLNSFSLLASCLKMRNMLIIKVCNWIFRMRYALIFSQLKYCGGKKTTKLQSFKFYSQFNINTDAK